MQGFTAPANMCAMQVLDCLDLPPEYASLLTTDDSETNLHAVGGLGLGLCVEELGHPCSASCGPEACDLL